MTNQHQQEVHFERGVYRIKMELAIDPVVDTSLADAHRRTNEWMAHAKAKPNRNEDEDTFAERVVSSLHRLHSKARI